MTQTLTHFQNLDLESKTALLLYSVDAAYPTQISFVDIDCRLLQSQIEAVEKLPTLDRLQLAAVLLAHLQRSLA